ncbi:type II toxin-antitoxin system HicB family antitoxin [Halolamina rubra]|uniref:type II toxin-antitoxin system HicB family antitoxin n=1 Tax=Halolamina rubra TaxID=1380430 RepID=UPI000678675A|nr:type II toxin-antitoxin system HicB family antitoxin [Halolamina rubra]
MSSDNPGSAGEPDGAQQITLTLAEDEEWWVARDEETGVSSQGRTREAALDNLDEAVAGYHGEGREPADEELLELGIDPAGAE